MKHRHEGKYRVVIPAKRFGAPRPRYFTRVDDARRLAQAIFDATGFIVAVELIDSVRYPESASLRF